VLLTVPVAPGKFHVAITKGNAFPEGGELEDPNNQRWYKVLLQGLGSTRVAC